MKKSCSGWLSKKPLCPKKHLLLSLSPHWIWSKHFFFPQSLDMSNFLI
jgi:hypothetical protein